VPAPPSDACSRLAEVRSVRPTGADAVILTVVPVEGDIPPVRASRFFMLKREDGLSPFVPRPYSIYRQRGRELEFLIKVMGKGSRALAASRPGEKLRLIGPLGNGWPTLDGEGAPWVMLAGGVGSAPFPLALEQALAGMDGKAPCPREKIAFFFGAATAGHLYDLEGLAAYGVPIETATMDGSHGRRGNVLDLLHAAWRDGRLPADVRLLACGPERMLEAVEALAIERGLEAYLSLETLMGCGVGICNCCPVPTRAGGALGAWPNAKCCVEGPVFRASDIVLAHG
jgi:dihydroorotate dehydrogenase electron transfer subunit